MGIITGPHHLNIVLKKKCNSGKCRRRLEGGGTKVEWGVCDWTEDYEEASRKKSQAALQ